MAFNDLSFFAAFEQGLHLSTYKLRISWVFRGKIQKIHLQTIFGMLLLKQYKSDVTVFFVQHKVC